MIAFLLFIIPSLVLVATNPISSGHASEGNDSGRIVGGQLIPIERVPYMVSIQRDGIHYCGGVIANEVTIFTAAHCIGWELQRYTVRAGSSSSKTGGQVRKVIRKYQHFDYEVFTFDYDIGVLKLEEPLVYSNIVQPVQFAEKRASLPVGELALITGWGTEEFGNGTYPEFLRGLQVPVYSENRCWSAYRHVTDRMLCAGGEAGKDSCQADSGGPLVWNGIHIGIASHGKDCALEGFPGVYTRISAVRDFIDEWMNK